MEAELIWVRVYSGNSSLIIGNCYRPENDKIHILNKIASSMERVLDEATDCILTGDFNFRNIDWDLLTGKSTKDETFINMTTSNLLTQMVTSPTRGNNIYT